MEELYLCVAAIIAAFIVILINEISLKLKPKNISRFAEQTDQFAESNERALVKRPHQNVNPYPNVEFSYTKESDLDFIRSLKLKSFDRYDVVIDRFFSQTICDSSLGIYFIEVWLEDHKLRQRRHDELVKKYKDVYGLTRKVDEHILLVEGNIVRIFSDISRHADGEEVVVLEIISDAYTSDDEVWLNNLIEKAFWFRGRMCPEFSYKGYRALFTLGKSSIDKS